MAKFNLTPFDRKNSKLLYLFLEPRFQKNHLFGILTDFTVLNLLSFEVVHCDLAARNCLVSIAEDGTEIVKISDFGLARELDINNGE